MARWMLVLCAVALFGSEDRAESEASLLLEHRSRIEAGAPAPLREQRLRDVADLPIRTERLVTLRDTCVDGHRALLRAEAEQDRAASSLAALTNGNPDATLTTAQAARIEQAI